MSADPNICISCNKWWNRPLHFNMHKGMEYSMCMHCWRQFKLDTGTHMMEMFYTLSNSGIYDLSDRMIEDWLCRN